MGAIPKDRLDKFNQAITEKGDELARAHVIRIVAGTNSTLWKDYRNIISTSPDTAKDVLNTKIQEVIAKDKARYQTEDIDKIDADTMWKIIDGVWWPSIKEVDVALVDHPNTIDLTSMRGIAQKTVIKSDGMLYNRKLDFAFAPLAEGYFADLLAAYEDIMRYTILDARPYSPQPAFGDQLTGGALSQAGTLEFSKRKAFLQELFTTEQAAKVWWISQFGNNPALGRPILTAANLNSYLGYFNMMIGWNGGDSALARRGIQAAEQKKFSTFPFDSNEFRFDDTPISSDVVSVGCCVSVLQAQYKWLQTQKTNENKEFYQGWFDRFFSNKKSLVNMLVIINERVHANGANEFQFSPKCGVRLKAMATALASKFKLEIGD